MPMEVAEMEFLRPLVYSSNWDYCVVWRLSDHLSRFIEWVGCCCSGYSNHCSSSNVKEEIIEDENQLAQVLCRDLHFKHPVRSKACEALANFPYSMPLDAGIYGEVIICGQSRWLYHDSLGTRVLIPVSGGLVELFAAKRVEEDRKIIDLISAQFSVPVTQEANNDFLDLLLLEDNLPNLLLSSHLLSFNHEMQFYAPLTQFNTNTHYLAFEGSSSASSTSNELQFSRFDMYSICKNRDSKQVLGRSSTSTKSEFDGRFGTKPPGCDNSGQKIIQRSSKVNKHSKNIVTERNRRKRLGDALLTLRALVPKISKMNRYATLGDAIEYIGDLEMEVKQLQEELNELEEGDSKRSTSLLNLTLGTLQEDTSQHLSTETAEKRKDEAQLEVNQIGKRSFQIKLVCEHRRNGFGRLMTTLDSLGFQVLDANISTLKGKVLSVLTIEVVSVMQGKQEGRPTEEAVAVIDQINQVTEEFKS